MSYIYSQNVGLLTLFVMSCRGISWIVSLSLFFTLSHCQPRVEWDKIGGWRVTNRQNRHTIQAYSGNGLVVASSVGEEDVSGLTTCLVMQRSDTSSLEWVIMGDPIQTPGGGMVSISHTGNTIVISGVPMESMARVTGEEIRAGIVRVGEVRAFRYTSGAWVQIGSTITGGRIGSVTASPQPDTTRVEFTGMLSRLSGDGSHLAINYYVLDVHGTDTVVSHAFVVVFEWKEGDWAMRGPRIYGHETSETSSLHAISVLNGAIQLSTDGNTLAHAYITDIPELNNASSTAYLEILTWSPSTNLWKRKGSQQMIWAPRYTRQINPSYSMSGDGNWIIRGFTACGANSCDGLGFAHVVHFDGNEWVQVGPDIQNPVGEWYNPVSMDLIQDQERFGTFVSMSKDGRTIAVGAPTNSDHRDNSGTVRIYYWVSSEWVQSSSNIRALQRWRRNSSLSTVYDDMYLDVREPSTMEEGSYFGDVSLSANGRSVMIGDSHAFSVYNCTVYPVEQEYVLNYNITLKVWSPPGISSFVPPNALSSRYLLFRTA